MENQDLYVCLGYRDPPNFSADTARSLNRIGSKVPNYEQIRS